MYLNGCFQITRQHSDFIYDQLETETLQISDVLCKNIVSLSQMMTYTSTMLSEMRKISNLCRTVMNQYTISTDYIARLLHLLFQ